MIVLGNGTFDEVVWLGPLDEINALIREQKASLSPYLNPPTFNPTHPGTIYKSGRGASLEPNYTDTLISTSSFSNSEK